MTYLLDTCVFLWMTAADENLSPLVRGLLEDSSNRLVLSQVSSLEIQIKFDRGKLAMTLPPEKFIPEAMARFNLDYQRIEDAHIWAQRKLPPLHRDPFDRLLVAQALHEGWPLLTSDQSIHAYPVRVIW